MNPYRYFIVEEYHSQLYRIHQDTGAVSWRHLEWDQVGDPWWGSTYTTEDFLKHVQEGRLIETVYEPDSEVA